MDEVGIRPILIHVTTVPQALSFFHGQIAYMQAHGVEVHAISSPGDKLDEFGEREHVKTHPVSMSREITPIQDLRALIRLTRVLYGVRPSIVHSHTPKGGLLGMIGAWLSRTPVRIYTIHGLRYATVHGGRGKLLRWTERIACKLSHEVICVSPSIRRVVIDDGICPHWKVRVLRGGSTNGVDASAQFDPARFTSGERTGFREELGLREDALVITFVGRLVRDKGIKELATAWRTIRNSRSDVKLLLVGPTESTDPVESGVMQELHSDPDVILTGSVTDTSKTYAVTDLLALPSYREGFPTVLLEAAAMELPVVATAIPGCVDAVRDGVTGTLVPVRDAGALGTAIKRYLDAPELREQHGKAGRVRVLSEFRQEDIWKAMLLEYIRLLDDANTAAPRPTLNP